jgi:hypothetical protein
MAACSTNLDQAISNIVALLEKENNGLVGIPAYIITPDEGIGGGKRKQKGGTDICVSTPETGTDAEKVFHLVLQHLNTTKNKSDVALSAIKLASISKLLRDSFDQTPESRLSIALQDFVNQIRTKHGRIFARKDSNSHYVNITRRPDESWISALPGYLIELQKNYDDMIKSVPQFKSQLKNTKNVSEPLLNDYEYFANQIKAEIAVEEAAKQQAAKQQDFEFYEYNPPRPPSRPTGILPYIFDIYLTINTDNTYNIDEFIYLFDTTYKMTDPDDVYQQGIVFTKGKFFVKTASYDTEPGSSFYLPPADGLGAGQDHNTLINIANNPKDLKKQLFAIRPNNNKYEFKQILYFISRIKTILDLQAKAATAAAPQAVHQASLAGGGCITILGRRRKIIKQGRTNYIKYKNELITLTVAKKLDKKKAK